MTAAFVFASLATAQIKVKTGPQTGKIPVGSDAAAIGKIRPGHYVANRDVKSLPTLAELGDNKALVFSGNVYVLSPSKPTQITPFIGGRKREFDSKTGKVSVGESLQDYIRSLGDKPDVHVAEATYAHFEVVLPTDAKRLAGFDGTITFFVKDMKPEQALTITLKKGKTTRSMP